MLPCPNSTPLGVLVPRLPGKCKQDVLCSAQVLRIIGARCHVGWCWILCFTFPVRLPVNLLLHAAMLPTLIHGAWCLLPTFSHPDLRPTLCEMGSFLSFFDAGLPQGACHELSVEAVTYSVRSSTVYVLRIATAPASLATRRVFTRN